MRAAIGRPGDDEYGDFYSGYVERAAGDDPLALLRRQLDEPMAALRALPARWHGHRYAEGKWTVQQVVSHLVDAERVFSQRALRFSRGDDQPLPGFDENLYVARAPLAERPWASCVAELEHQRRANLELFSWLPAEAWTRSGEASGHKVTVRALAFILAGHFAHHQAVLAERYGVDLGD